MILYQTFESRVVIGFTKRGLIGAVSKSSSMSIEREVHALFHSL